MSAHAVALLVIAGACSADHAGRDAPGAGWLAGPALPEPVSNNAVAAISDHGRCSVYSVLGIDGSRGSSGIHARGYVLDDQQWRAIPDVPGVARIAASAVALRGHVYVLGGYSVATNGTETSHTEVEVYDPSTGTWSGALPLPTAIDDAVAVPWQDRWIVVISGWSNTRPVASAPYNYDGLSYATGQPSPPLSDTMTFDLATKTFSTSSDSPAATMDHRGLAECGDTLALIGGMDSGPVVSSDVWVLRP